MKRRFVLFLSIILISVACDLPAFSVSSVATPIPGVIGTTIAETAIAAQSQTAVSRPPTQSPTRPPTSTATQTKTPLPTSTILFLFPTDTAVVLPTLLVVGSGKPTKTPSPNEHNYSGTIKCAVVGQSPPDGTAFKPRKKFTVTWTIKNIGTAAWRKHTIDIKYISGHKFDDRGAYDMNFIVDPGETIDVHIEMYAPKEPGNYEATWAVGLNKGGLCKMTLSIVVK